MAQSAQFDATPMRRAGRQTTVQIGQKFEQLLTALREEHSCITAKCRTLDAENATLRVELEQNRCFAQASPRSVSSDTKSLKSFSIKQAESAPNLIAGCNDVNGKLSDNARMDGHAGIKLVLASNEWFDMGSSASKRWTLAYQSKSSLTDRKDARLDDTWTELFILNEYEAQSDLEKMYTKSRGATRRSAGTQVDLGSVMHSNKAFVDGMLLPQSRERLSWDLVGMVLILFDMIIIPYFTAWGLAYDTVLSVLTLLGTVYWNFDIGLNFFTATYIKGNLIVNKRVVAMSYLRSWFCFDVLVVCMDWFLILLGDTLFKGNVGWIRGVRMLKLLRTVKLNSLSHALEDNCEARGKQHLIIVANIFKIVLTILLTTHMFACALYFVGQLQMSEGKANWIETYDLARHTLDYQYTITFHWILCQFTPAPNPHQPQGPGEQLAVIIIIMVSLPIMGSSIARMNGNVTLLNAKMAERSQLKRQLQQYLRMNKINVDLCSRILRCAEHVLQNRGISMQKPAAINLLPSTLHDELAMAQMGRKFRVHPLFRLLLDAKVNINNELCQAFKPQSFEPNQEVFVEGAKASKMYVLCKGSYQLCKLSACESDLAFSPTKSLTSYEEVKCDDVAKWFSEASLFTKKMHETSLVAVTFGDGVVLMGGDLAKALRNSPVSIITVHEYATCILKEIRQYMSGSKDLDTEYNSDFMPTNASEDACQTTQLSEIVYSKRGKFLPSKKYKANKSSQSHSSSGETTTSIGTSISVGTCASASTTASTSTFTSADKYDGASSLQFICSACEGDITNDDINSRIDRLFHELDAADGIYMRLDHMDERRRVLLAMRTCFWLIRDDYESLVACQRDHATRLTRETWAELQQFVTWANLGTDSIHGVLVFLTIRGLGKSKEFVRACPPNARRQPELAVRHATECMQYLMPSLQHLSSNIFQVLYSVLDLITVFNFSQLLQGENIAQSVGLFQDAVKDKGEEALRFYLFALVCMMCGLTGTVTLGGSLFLTEQNAISLLLGIRCLQNVQTMDARTIYWSYIASRAHLMQVPYTSPEALVFARLLCMTRTHDQHGLAAVQDAWERLAANERETIVANLFADGLEDRAFLFIFLPGFFANAIKNESIGLYGALTMLIKVIEQLRKHDFSDCEEQTISVDLNDLASIVGEVRSIMVLDECIDHSKALQAGSRITIVMTSKSWQAASETNKQADPVDDMARGMKYMMRRQADMQVNIDKVLSLVEQADLFDRTANIDDYGNGQGDSYSVASEELPTEEHGCPRSA